MWRRATDAQHKRAPIEERRAERELLLWTVREALAVLRQAASLLALLMLIVFAAVAFANVGTDCNQLLPFAGLLP